MKLFDAAYLKLTAWYAAIIMIISLLLSFWVYSQARQELQTGFGGVGQIGPFNDLDDSVWRSLLDERLEDSRHRLIVRLVGFNMIVLVAGTAGSYWLARRTMRPVEEMVEEQHRFTADASHELRTPLAAMKAEIEVGLRGRKLTRDEAIELLQSNLEEVDRLGSLTDGLLTLTQASGSARLRPVSLEKITSKVARRLQSLADAKHITITKHFEPVIAQGDEAALDKIIGILLDNAIKYSPEATEIVLRGYAKDGYGYVEVQDRGIGIKASELPHIFDRFYRADTSRSAMYAAGHGLGLSIAQKLAEDLNAKISVVSTPGAGSTFVLQVPMASAV